MDKNLTGNFCPDYEGGDEVVTSFARIFNEQFPLYLVMGMTYELYWDGDPQLVKSYREADRLRKEREGQMAWWQGYYTYAALAAVSPLFRGGKGKVTAHPYVEKPIRITPLTKAEQELEDKKDLEKFITMLENL